MDRDLENLFSELTQAWCRPVDRDTAAIVDQPSAVNHPSTAADHLSAAGDRPSAAADQPSSTAGQPKTAAVKSAATSDQTTITDR